MSFAQEQTSIIIFSGSDWCNNCLRLKEKVLSNEEVKSMLETDFVLIEADFPRDDSHMEKDVIERNEALAEKFNQNGYFPSVVIIKDGKEIARRDGYRNELPETYLSWLEKHK
mgnify:CR=1 FL=1